MSQLFENNAVGRLLSSITNVATTIVLQAGHGARFPAPTGGSYFYATMFTYGTEGEEGHEIVKCTARSGDSLTVVRGQQDTTAAAFAENTRFELRFTRELLAENWQNDDQTIPGQWTFTGASYVFNNVGAQIKLDSSSQKGIYCNDGAGNFIIRAGHRYYNPGAGADERHPVAGDGAAKITFSTDAQAGSIAILVGSGTAALADDPVVWGTGVFLNNSGFYLGGSAVEANRFVYQGLAATITGSWDFQGGVTIDGVGQATQVDMHIDADAGHAAVVIGQTAGSNRWKWGKDGTAETGSNAGSNFSIQRYTDAGAYVDTPLTINRATGAMTLSGALSVTGAATFDENPTLNKVGDAEDATWQTASDAGKFAGVRIQTGATLRWLIGKNYEAETGSDAGSNFQFRRYNDAGTYQDSPIQIERDDGTITLGAPLSANGYSTFKSFVEIEHLSPQLRFYETDAALDSKRWRWVADGGFMDLRLRTDDESTETAAIRFNRSGTTPGQISMYSALGVSGNIFTNEGYLQVTRNGDAADAALYIDRDAGQRGLIAFRSGTSQRWILETNGVAEGGSDAGSDFVLSHYSDAGTLLGTAIKVVRSSGNVHIYNDFYPETNVVMGGGFLHLNRSGDATAAIIYMSADAGHNRAVVFRTGTTSRWQLFVDNAAESGSDVGSDFRIARYDDSGFYQDAPILISRSTGQVAISNALKGQKVIYNDAVNDEGNSGTSLTVDWTLKNFATFTLTGNATITFTPPAGPAFLHLRIVQDATGGRTVTWPSTVEPGISVGSAANEVTNVCLAWTGTEYHVVSMPDNAEGDVSLPRLLELATGFTVTALELLSASVGMIARVTDAKDVVLGDTVTDTGTSDPGPALVWYNGTNWTVIGK